MINTDFDPEKTAVIEPSEFCVDHGIPSFVFANGKFYPLYHGGVVKQRLKFTKIFHDYIEKLCGIRYNSCKYNY